MKVLLSAFVFINLVSFTGIADAQSRKSIGLHYSFPASSTIISFLDREGTGGYEGRYMYNFGTSYIHGMNRVLDLETGLDYSSHSLLLHPAFTGEPGQKPFEKRVKLLTVPLLLRVNLGKYVYLNGGPVLDIDISKPRQTSSQTGIGAALGAGFRYAFKSGVSVFVNPNARFHGTYVFFSGPADYQVVEGGVKLGVAYALAP